MNIPFGPILIVEDVPNILELLTLTLRFKGYPVITASNGAEALEAVMAERPALIITDILMPKMDGYALVQKLRLNPETRNIPIVFLSATYVTPEDKAFALSLGAVRFIEKPIDTEDFLLTVAELLSQGPLPPRDPLEEEAFYQGYSQRLKTKLKHKEMQIARARRLLMTLPDEQKPAFETLLAQAIQDRNEIQAELDEVNALLEEKEPPAAAEEEANTDEEHDSA